MDNQGNHIAYIDMVGVVTACWGLTGKDMYGNKIVPGTKYTQQECETTLVKDLKKFNDTVNKAVTVEMKPYEEIAYTSLAWNIGTGAFSNSTLVKKLNAGDREAACKGILDWNRATFPSRGAQTQIKNGEKCTVKKDGNYSCTVRGLTNRRNHEYKVCIGEDEAVNNALKELEAFKKPSEAIKDERSELPPIPVETNAPSPSESVPEVLPSYEASVPLTIPECRWKFFNVCLKRD